jgi:hypothetical protein
MASLVKKKKANTLCYYVVEAPASTASRASPAGSRRSSWAS